MSRDNGSINHSIFFKFGTNVYLLCEIMCIVFIDTVQKASVQRYTKVIQYISAGGEKLLMNFNIYTAQNMVTFT